MRKSLLHDGQAKRGEQRDRILAAARQVFARDGYHGATTRAIAAQAGLDVSTLYYHVGRKEEVFDAVLERLQLDFEDRLRVWVRESKGASLARCFELAVTHFDSFFLDRDTVRVLQLSFFDDGFAGRSWAVESQRQLVGTLRTFTEKRFGAEAIPAEFELSILSFIASTITLVGSRHYLAAVLGLDPNGGEYRELLLRTLRRTVGSFITSLVRVEGCAEPSSGAQ